MLADRDDDVYSSVYHEILPRDLPRDASPRRPDLPRRLLPTTSSSSTDEMSLSSSRHLHPVMRDAQHRRPRYTLCRPANYGRWQRNTRPWGPSVPP